MQIPTSFETLRYTFSRPLDPTGYRKQTPKGLGPTVVGAQHKYPRGLLERRVAGPVTEALSSPPTPQQNVRRPLRQAASACLCRHQSCCQRGCRRGDQGSGCRNGRRRADRCLPRPLWHHTDAADEFGASCEPPLPLCKRRPCPNHTFWALLCAPFLKHGSRGPSPSGIEMRVFAVVWLWFADRKLDFPLWCTVGLPEGEWQAALARTPTPALPYGSCATRSSPFCTRMSPALLFKALLKHRHTCAASVDVRLEEEATDPTFECFAEDSHLSRYTRQQRYQDSPCCYPALGARAMNVAGNHRTA